MIILIVILLIILGYFGLNIKNISNSSTVSDNLHYAWSLVVSFWNNFLVVPAKFVWDKIIIGFIWNGIMNLVHSAQAGVTAH